VVSSSSASGKLLRSSWHLFHLAFTQCGQIGRNAVLAILTESCSCPVVRLTSSFHTWWYHLIPNCFCKHRWSRASILSTSLLVTAQHSGPPYRKIGRMHVLYNSSFVEIAILDFQIWLSRFCIATRVMALQREISGEL